MSISLCMIVKNEEEVLADCLSSVKGFVDEIIVVDTGSTDKTADIAKQHGALVFSFPWDNHFSNAKNYAIRKATKDWILWLDADEILPESEKKKIIAAITSVGQHSLEHHGIEGFRTPIKNFIALQPREMKSGAIPFQPADYPEEYQRGANAYFISTTIRLFRNIPSLFFVGQIHELLNKDADMSAIQQSHITIHHYGYLRSKERLEQKKELYLQLGKEKAAKEQTPASLVELSSLYFDRKEFELAKSCLQKAILLKPNVLEWYYNLAVIHKYLGHIDAAEQVLREAIFLPQKEIELYINKNPYPFIFASLAEVFYKKRLFGDALFLFQKAKKQQHPNSTLIDEAIEKCQKKLQEKNSSQQSRPSAFA